MRYRVVYPLQTPHRE